MGPLDFLFGSKDADFLLRANLGLRSKTEAHWLCTGRLYINHSFNGSPVGGFNPTGNIGNFPQIGVETHNIANHQLVRLYHLHRNAGNL